VAASTFGLHFWFFHNNQRNSSSWSLAISFVAALAAAIPTSLLAYITWRYEKLTRELVRIQGDYVSQARARYREEAVQDMNSLLADIVIVLETARLPFPLTDEVFPKISLASGGGEMAKLAQDMSRLHPCLPLEFVAACRDAVQIFTNAAAAQFALYESIRNASMHFQQDLTDPSKTWTWQDCENAQQRLIRNHQIWECDWSDLWSGIYVLEAYSVHQKLRSSVIEYMTNDI
jgi:hypothetical protein